MGTHGYNAREEREQNTFGRRLGQLRREKGLTLSALSDALKDCGIALQPAAIHKWETGLSVPNVYQAAALCRILESDALLLEPQPPLNPLGQKKLREYRRDLIACGYYAPEPVYLTMPVSCLPASAGVGNLLSEEAFESLSVPADSVPEGADFGIYVRGDSMEPVYQDGDLVWVQKTQSLRSGQVGLFVYDDAGYIKVFEDAEGVPRLCSYNPAYTPICPRPGLELRIIGRILD